MVDDHLKLREWSGPVEKFLFEVYAETENLCKEYAKTKGVGTQAIPERHAFFKNLGTVLARIAEKCERENGMM